MIRKDFKRFTLALIGAFVLVLVGCRSAPIYNVSDAPIDQGVENPTAKNVKKAIKIAGASLGWQIKDAGPGKLEGILFLRKHMAKIDIPYSEKGYSLLYKDSSKLDYTAEEGGKIHKNYNGWIQNLDRAIKTQLLAL